MDILLEVSRRRLPTIGGPPARPRANYGGQGSQNSEWLLIHVTCWILKLQTFKNTKM
jgi:hypothetical protein